MAGSLTDIVHPTTSERDEVVLLDEDGHATGTAARLLVHTADTPLHLAFSVYLVNDADEVLLTRRALGKRTWPGVWTNACCGHPRPGEAITDAVVRRLGDELGLPPGAVTGLECVLPDFRYRAVDASGIVENEICPTYRAQVHPAAVVAANAEEVMEWRWVAWGDVTAVAQHAPFVLSPWSVDQIAQLGRARS